ncbi:MAG: ergothioneine biosynthesis protein EgtB [Actinomycetota bacterium]|nr:ergothioneine biosynthesis protein EgtB [Actinomycetota bacterium]
MTLKEKVRGELLAARRRTLDLLARLPDDELVRPHSAIMSPLVWDLAHLGHFEELWLVRALGDEPLADARYDDIYDAFRHERSERPSLPLLPPSQARGYIGFVRERALELLEAVDLDDRERLTADGFVYGMVVQHEHQHNETMLATLQLREGEPYPLSEPEPPPVERPADTEVLVPQGPFLLGTDDEPWAYDNERRAHEVDLPSFWIDAGAVTNDAFLSFVDAGGYGDRRWWSEAGWEWCREERAESPRFWRREPDASWSVVRFGRAEPLALAAPVQHVSWYEADAYARWVDKRLPTEAEWEKAASWDAEAGRKRSFPWGDDPPTAARANTAHGWFRPLPAGSFPAGASPYGCQQMIGDVWEWTASDFLPYRGFEAFPYREYSEVFFGSEYKVLRGGSWATHGTVARPTFRNWDLPVRRQIFAGFRCARDA